MNRLRANQSVTELSQGDITEQVVDAIVNAANSRLMGECRRFTSDCGCMHQYLELASQAIT